MQSDDKKEAPGNKKKFVNALDISQKMTEALQDKFSQAKDKFEAARDMNKYFMQQIWLQNYPRIFDFFVEKFEDLEEALFEIIWKMPEPPQSEVQQLDMKAEFNEYLDKLKGDR